MPDEPRPKPRSRPPSSPTPPPRAGPADASFVELGVTTNFTFLDGASHPDEMMTRAAALGYAALGIADRNTLAGVVRAHVAAKRAGVRLVVGSRVVTGIHTHAGPEPAGPKTGAHDPALALSLALGLFPINRRGYANLCRLLTLGKRRAPKGECALALHDVAAHADDLLAVVVPPPVLDDTFIAALRWLRTVFADDRLSLAMRRRYGADDAVRLRQTADLAAHVGVPAVATNDVLYHDPARRPLQDVLTAIRHGCTVDRAGLRLLANAERHLKPPAEIARLFAAYPGAVDRSVQIADRARFSLDELRYEYPDEVVPEGSTAMQHLAALTWAGAAERYPAGVPAKVRALLDHELRLIDDLRYAPYFLTVHDIVAFARGRGILCQGRGAAANSAVCYCLGVTAVDPDRVHMLFERFVSKERDEPPDIDIDFEHERREEVIQYLYAKYGRSRAALTAEVIAYRGRLAVREVGKAMGLSADGVRLLAGEVEWWHGGPPDLDRLRDLGLNPRDPHLARTLTLAGELLGFPRHRSQHVGGFVITRTPLCELVPIENAAMPDRTIIEWDKDDIEAMGMMKVDLLGLGMLTCIRKALDLVGRSTGSPTALHEIPPEDPRVYDMICNADTVGVFQIESRAQMSMLPRLRPRCYYDLVIEVAIVRPGPIQGRMVHPYLRRRCGEEPVTYHDETIRAVLQRTLGVPLFQEQAMSLAVAAAGFTPGEADDLRRAIGAWKTRGDRLAAFATRLIDGMTARGYPSAFAAQVFEQIKGFSGYGFPESHAASFALLVYASSWLKRYHPAAFACALLNSQPMGFYQPAQIVIDAAAHGVDVRPVDALRSAWDCTLEHHGPTPRRPDMGPCPGAPAEPAPRSSSGPALRLGLRMIKGLAEAQARRIVACLASRTAPASLEALWRASGVQAGTMRLLAAADAFASMGLSRREAIWRAQSLRDGDLPLFDTVDRDPAHETAGAEDLPAASASGEVRADYGSVGLSLRAHPVSFIRDRLDASGATRHRDLADAARFPHGTPVTVAGIVLVRQRPATASGIVFITLEDETGVANLIVRPGVFERDRRAARHATILLAHGVVERQGVVVHVLARRLERLSADGLPAASRDFH